MQSKCNVEVRQCLASYCMPFGLTIADPTSRVYLQWADLAGMKQRDLQMREGSLQGLITTCCPPTKAGVPTAIRDGLREHSPVLGSIPLLRPVPFVVTALLARAQLLPPLYRRVRNWWGQTRDLSTILWPQDIRGSILRQPPCRAVTVYEPALFAVHGAACCNSRLTQAND
jgi:hypothetical protein